MFLSVILLIIGFVLLIKGADYFVEGASHLAMRFHIPQIVIGLTIVAFGTSAPEAAISITSSLKNSSDLAVGNIIGSNIINVLVILGIVGCISTLKVKKTTYNIEIPFVLLITLLLLVLGKKGNELSVLDGIILLIFFAVFFIYLIFISKKEKQEKSLEEIHSIGKIIALLLFGIVGIIAGSQLTIDSVNCIAVSMGLSQRFIGLTVVAFGTSLPELVTSLIASLKGKDDLSIGNIIGSNIFNILFVLGFSATLFGPIVFIDKFILDGLVAIGAMMILYIFINKEYILRKIGAILMLIVYIIYFIYIM